MCIPGPKPLVATNISSKEKHFQVGLREGSSNVSKFSALGSCPSKLKRLIEKSLLKLPVRIYFIFV